MYYSTGYPCFPSIVNTNKLKRSRVVVNEIFVSFNSSNTADWPTQDDLFPPFIHTKLVIWGTPKLPPFSIFHGNPICTFLGSFFPSSLTHFWGYCHFGPRTEKSILWKPDEEAKAFMLLNMCAVIFAAVLAPHVMMWNAANVEKRRANMNVMCPQQEMGHRKSTLCY